MNIVDLSRWKKHPWASLFLQCVINYNHQNKIHSPRMRSAIFWKQLCERKAVTALRRLHLFWDKSPRYFHSVHLSLSWLPDSKMEQDFCILWAGCLILFETVMLMLFSLQTVQSAQQPTSGDQMLARHRNDILRASFIGTICMFGWIVDIIGPIGGWWTSTPVTKLIGSILVDSVTCMCVVSLCVFCVYWLYLKLRNNRNVKRGCIIGLLAKLGWVTWILSLFLNLAAFAFVEDKMWMTSLFFLCLTITT